MSNSTRSKTLQLKDDLAEDIESFQRCEFDAKGSDLPDEDIRAIVRLSDDRHIRSNFEHRGIEILGNTHWMRKKIEERLLLEKNGRDSSSSSSSSDSGLSAVDEIILDGEKVNLEGGSGDYFSRSNVVALGTQNAEEKDNVVGNEEEIKDDKYENENNVEDKDEVVSTGDNVVNNEDEEDTADAAAKRKDADVVDDNMGNTKADGGVNTLGDEEENNDDELVCAAHNVENDKDEEDKGDVRGEEKFPVPRLECITVGDKSAKCLTVAEIHSAFDSALQTAIKKIDEDVRVHVTVDSAVLPYCEDENAYDVQESVGDMGNQSMLVRPGKGRSPIPLLHMVVWNDWFEFPALHVDVCEFDIQAQILVQLRTNYVLSHYERIKSAIVAWNSDQKGVQGLLENIKDNNVLLRQCIAENKMIPKSPSEHIKHLFTIQLTHNECITSPTIIDSCPDTVAILDEYGNATITDDYMQVLLLLDELPGSDPKVVQVKNDLNSLFHKINAKKHLSSTNLKEPVVKSLKEGKQHRTNKKRFPGRVYGKKRNYCRICSKLETEECPIINEGCSEECRDIIRAYKRRKQKEREDSDFTQRRCLPDDGIGQKKMGAVEKITSYYRDVLNPSIFNAGLVTGWTLSTNVPDCLKKHGVALLSEGIPISSDLFEEVVEEMRKFRWTEKLFTGTDARGKTNFLSKNEPGRYVTTDSKEIGIVTKWNHFEKKVRQMLVDCNFQYNRFDLKYSVFKSDSGLLVPQVPHCDVMEPGECSKRKGTKFPFVALVGLEEYSFVEYESLRTKLWTRVCIRRGDVFFFRGDVVHRGCENYASHEHFRIHVYIDPKALADRDKSDNSSTVIADDSNEPEIPKYDPSKNVWTMDSNVPKY